MQAEAPIATIAGAFSATAERYDAFAGSHPHLTRIREKVYACVAEFVPAGASLLELNAGTGTDAVALARRGHRVHATDVAAGMLARQRAKVESAGLQDAVTVQECSFLDLDRVDGGPFDAALSNLGGLNCTADLAPVAAGLRRLVAPGGVAVLVVMPRICLWELALVLTGQVRLATRRLRRGGTIAHLEGRHFPVHYFTPRHVVRAFAAGFDVMAVRGLSVLTPTLESKNLAIRHRRAYAALAWLDDRLSPRRPFRAWGDFAVVVLRRRAQP
ncbi:MAG TPA: class I SAM-dependent methyltransferase [Candidatus Dormibacteraeota bacterium]|nr:class I SAM-dependent methyltransferase [Candidatus Dormibacteraeota bacterium]